LLADAQIADVAVDAVREDVGGAGSVVDANDAVERDQRRWERIVEGHAGRRQGAVVLDLEGVVEGAANRRRRSSRTLLRQLDEPSRRDRARARYGGIRGATNDPARARDLPQVGLHSWEAKAVREPAATASASGGTVVCAALSLARRRAGR
jgi:hypothetical protein